MLSGAWVMLQLPRVPMHGLTNIVPPQDPDHPTMARVANTLVTAPAALAAAATLPALQQASECSQPTLIPSCFSPFEPVHVVS